MVWPVPESSPEKKIPKGEATTSPTIQMSTTTASTTGLAASRARPPLAAVQAALAPRCAWRTARLARRPVLAAVLPDPIVRRAAWDAWTVRAARPLAPAGLPTAGRLRSKVLTAGRPARSAPRVRMRAGRLFPGCAAGFPACPGREAELLSPVAALQCDVRGVPVERFSPALGPSALPRAGDGPSPVSAWGSGLRAGLRGSRFVR